MKEKKVNHATLKQAFINTCSHRNVSYYNNNQINFNQCEATIKLIQNNAKMNSLWNNYTKSYDFAKDVTFSQTIDSAMFWLDKIKEYNQ